MQYEVFISFNISIENASSTLCFSPFPTVAEAVQEELEAYRAQDAEVKRLKTAMVSSLF